MPSAMLRISASGGKIKEKYDRQKVWFIQHQGTQPGGRYKEADAPGQVTFLTYTRGKLPG